MLAFILIFIVVCVVYAFLIMPRSTERPSFDGLLADYAHRGCYSSAFPENSLGAFKRAMESGFGIELDVRMTKDRQIVVFHDSNLLRMCGVDKEVKDLTLSEIKELRLKDTEFEIPTLWEVFELVDGEVPVLIEIKGEGKSAEISYVLSDILDSYGGAFCVSSFNPYCIKYFKTYRPQFVRGQHMSNFFGKNIGVGFFPKLFMTLLFANSLSRPDFIAFDTRCDKNFSLFLCLKVFGIKGFAWTVRDVDTLKKYKRAGLCAIFEKFDTSGKTGGRNEKNTRG